MEIIKLHSEYNIEERLTYGDLIYWKDKEVKLKEEKEIFPKLGWWRYSQIRNLILTRGNMVLKRTIQN